jgi:DNA repair exonuclease SbcCD ATPase subunit
MWWLHWIFPHSICYSKAHNLSSSPAMEGELETLRARVRDLERAVAESEALSLQQIECIQRLERQLQEQERALQACQEEKARLEQRPTLEAFQQQQQHIEELQNLLWEMERRPTLEHYQLLQQQLQTSQAEIETLKAELQRRIEPARFYQLQQELWELKQQANQLGEYAAKLPQVQLLQAQFQLRIQELEKEKEQLQAQVRELETQRAELEAAHRQAEAEWQSLKTQLESEKAHLEAELNKAWQQLRQLEHLRQQASFAKAERASLLEELQQSRQQQAEQAQQIAQLEAQLQALRSEQPPAEPGSGRDPALEEQVQALSREVDTLRAERDHLLQELAQRPAKEELEEAQRAREVAEARYLLGQKEIEKLQQQVAALQAKCAQIQAYAQAQEREVALLQQRNRELEEQLAALRQSAPSRAGVELRSSHPTGAAHCWRHQERLQALPAPPAPSPEVAAVSTSGESPRERTPVGGIPPLTLKEGEDRTERLLKRSLLATGRGSGEGGERSRIELPTFVQRRLY